MKVQRVVRVLDVPPTREALDLCELRAEGARKAHQQASSELYSAMADLKQTEGPLLNARQEAKHAASVLETAEEALNQAKLHYEEETMRMGSEAPEEVTREANAEKINAGDTMSRITAASNQAKAHLERAREAFDSAEAARKEAAESAAIALVAAAGAADKMDVADAKLLEAHDVCDAASLAASEAHANLALAREARENQEVMSELAATVAATQRDHDWARAALEKTRAEQLTVLQVAETAVDIAEHAETEKKRTAQVAAQAKEQLAAAEQAVNVLKTAFFDAMSRASEVRKSAAVAEVNYKDKLERRIEVEKVLRNAQEAHVRAAHGFEVAERNLQEILERVKVAEFRRDAATDAVQETEQEAKLRHEEAVALAAQVVAIEIEAEEAAVRLPRAVRGSIPILASIRDPHDVWALLACASRRPRTHKNGG